MKWNRDLKVGLGATAALLSLMFWQQGGLSWIKHKFEPTPPRPAPAFVLVDEPGLFDTSKSRDLGSFSTVLRTSKELCKAYEDAGDQDYFDCYLLRQYIPDFAAHSRQFFAALKVHRIPGSDRINEVRMNIRIGSYANEPDTIVMFANATPCVLAAPLFATVIASAIGPRNAQIITGHIPMVTTQASFQGTERGIRLSLVADLTSCRLSIEYVQQ
jgi:hypothetical protein